MIYQHRHVVVRKGRLALRHDAFQSEAMAAFDAHGSTLIGAWETVIGPDAMCAVWQLRQFDSLLAWETHYNRLREDRQLSANLGSRLNPHNDFVDTALLVLADGSPPLPDAWPSIEEVRGRPRGYVEQRILYFRPDTSGPHHDFYFSSLAPALRRDGAELIALLDTLVGPGTTNAGSHRSVELRRFEDLRAYQAWREAQENDESLRRLVNVEWLARVERVESALLRPLDYSRIR